MTFTRTITITTYTCGVFNPVTLSVDNITTHSYVEELGKRALSRLANDFGPVLNTTKRDILVAIDAMDFLAKGTIIEADGEKVPAPERAALANSLQILTLDNWPNELPDFAPETPDPDEE